MPEFAKYETANGVVIFCADLGFKNFIEFVNSCDARNEQVTIWLSLHRCVVFVVLIPDFTDQFFEAIFECHETCQQSIFVSNHRQVKLFLLHLAHQISDRFHFGHDLNRVQSRLYRLRAATRSFCGYQIFCVHDTD